MKGLLLKDFYVVARQCRIHLAIIVLFSVMSLGADTGLLYLMYPILFAGMIPTFILSTDEKCGWGRYAQALPYTRRDIVTEKYLVALISLGGAAALMLALWGVKLIVTGGSFAALLRTMVLVVCFGLLFPAVTLPPMLRFGVEKGRVITMGMAAGCAMAAVVVTLLSADPDTDPAAMAMTQAAGIDAAGFFGLRLGAVAAAAAVLFCLSWLLAVGLYGKREL